MQIFQNFPFCFEIVNQKPFFKTFQKCFYLTPKNTVILKHVFKQLFLKTNI